METPSGTLSFTVLGPVRAWRDGVELDLGPPTQRAILALLLAQAGQPVNIGEFVDVLWGGDPPHSAVNIVHRHIGMLRRLFEPALPTRAAGRWLVRSGGGYRLTADHHSVDLLRFRQRRTEAREADGAGLAEHGVRRFVEALGLWQGAVATGLEPHIRTHPVFTALDWEYVSTVRELADAALRADLVEPALPTVRLAAAAHPLDESLHARLILTLAAAGRQAEALERYHAIRTRLTDDLGIDPGPELRGAHDRVLRQQVTPERTPAASAASATPAQLPADLSAFTGRDQELAQALALLPEPAPAADAAPGPGGGAGRARRAVSQPAVVISAIGGMAGIGKTTLAVHWAHRIAHRFPDGQLYINLRGFDPTGEVASPGEAIRGFLEAFGVLPQRIPASLDAQAALYRSLLADRRILVVLDNARDVDQVRPLLPGSPGCLVIVTSRDRLAGLVAVEGAHPLTLDLFPAGTAWDFLARRLGADRVAADPAAVEEIITRCAGLPLALAVVAARAAAHPRFPLAAIAAELREAHGSLDAFAGAGAGIDARAVFSWSYRTLSVDAARLFRLLSLHPGPTVGAQAAASLAGAPVRQVRSSLAELASAHLVSEQAPGRYAYHDLLRAYAAELSETVDTADARRDAVHRLLDHYVHTGYRAGRLVAPLAEPVTPAAPRPGVVVGGFDTRDQAMAWFDAEYPTLPGAVELATRTGLDAHTWHLAWVSRPFLDLQAHWQVWLTVQRAAVAAAERMADPVTRTHAHRMLGLVYQHLGRDDEAQVHITHTLDLAQALGDRTGQAFAHRVLAISMTRRGQLWEALGATEAARDLYRAAGDLLSEGSALNEVGYLRTMTGDPRQGLADCQAALDLIRAAGGYRRVEAATWDSLGYAHRQLGDYPQAAACYRRAAGLSHEEGDRYAEATKLGRLGDVQHDAGDRGDARATWRQALSILEELRHPDADLVRAKLSLLGPAPPAGTPDPARRPGPAPSVTVQ